MSDFGDRAGSGAQPYPTYGPTPPVGTPQNPAYGPTPPVGAPQNPHSGPNPFAVQPNHYAQQQFGAPPHGYAPRPPRSSNKPLFLALGAVALIVVLGLTAVVLLVVNSADNSPERQARSALATAQLRLLHTPAVRYEGTLTGTAAGSPTMTVNLVVTNVGEATGTLAVGSASLDYLGVGGTSFLTGDESDWRALGVPKDKIELYLNRPVLIGPDLFGVDLATVLAPARLALALDPEATYDTAVRVGAEARVGDHQSTPVTSGDVTTYLRGLAGGEESIITRIINNAAGYSGAGRDRLPEFTLDTTYLTASEATTVYAEFPGRIQALSTAIDSRVDLGGTLNGRFLENPCLGTCTIEFTIKNTVSTSPDIRITSISYDYTITVESALDITTGPDCVGTGTMSPNSSTAIRCTATYNPYLVPAGQTVPINAFAHVTVRALNPEQLSALEQQVAQNGTAATALTPTTQPDPTTDWNAYSAAGGPLTHDAWTTAHTALRTRADQR
ncbi:DUF3824 domain-containing protein [Nocardia lasii]|uniref:DUF3824 domain-containing protein n=1 Tax=Nocardia lasii TaxID=1616107 RepID=A0ABW1JX78_9NOCA